MSYPSHLAEDLIGKLDNTVSRQGGNVFFGPLSTSPHGEEYRSTRVDVTRQEWHRVKQTAFKEGWRTFGNDSIIFDLPDGCHVVAQANF